jgi:MFS family permease
MNANVRPPAYLLPSLILLASVSGLGVGVSRTITSFYALELQASEVELGLIAGAQSVGIIFVSLPMGIFVQRYGPRIMYAVGGLLGGVFFCLTPWVQQIWFLILCTLLGGCVMPARFVALNTVFLAQLEKLGVERAGWFRATHMLGFMIVAPAIAVFLNEHFSYVGAFIGIGLIFFFPVLLAPLAITPHFPVPGGVLPRLGWREIFAQLHLIVTEADLRRINIFEFLTQAIAAYFSFFAIVIAMQTYKVSEANAAMLITAEGGFFVAALFLSGRLINRLGRARAYQFAFLLLGISLAVLSAPVQYVFFWAASCVLGVGLAMIYIINFTHYGQIGKRVGMGRISAISALIGPSGGFLGSILGGLFGGVWALQTVFLLLGILCLFSLLSVSLNADAIPDFPVANSNTQTKEVS